MTNRSYKPAHYLPHVDGLRGIAVLVILLFHLDITLIKGGFVGVDIFFVISGFLITSIILRDIKKEKFSFTNFYARRIKRIFPALFVMLFISALLALIFLGPEEFNTHFKAVRMASAQISNFYFSRELDYFAADEAHAPLLHTWSLGVEEQFYLIWPLLLVLLHKRLGRQTENHRIFIYLLIIMMSSMAISEYLVRTDTMQAFYHLHSRAWELAIGGIVAIGVIKPINNQAITELLAALGIGLILFSSLFLDSENFPGLKALPACFGASMFIYAAQGSRTAITHKLLSQRPIVFLGLMSYSLYLWHWPIVAFYKSYFGTELTSTVQISMALLSIALGYLSYKYIEQPFRLMAPAPKRTIALGLLAIVSFVVLSNVAKKQSKASWRVTYELNASITSPHKLFKTCSVDGGAYDKENCYIGPNKDQYEVILVGDSFASHYVPTILGWARSKGLTVRIFTRGDCHVWVKTQKTRFRAGKEDTFCNELTPAFYKTLEQDRSIQYVFVGLKSPKLDEETKASMEHINSLNKKVIFLGTGPLFRKNPHVCQIKNHLLITKIFPAAEQKHNCLAIDMAYTNKELTHTHADFIPFLNSLNVPYFDPTPFLQDPYNEDKQYLFADEGHLNQHGGEYLVPYFSDFMEKQN